MKHQYKLKRLRRHPLILSAERPHLFGRCVNVLSFKVSLESEFRTPADPPANQQRQNKRSVNQNDSGKCLLGCFIGLIDMKGVQVGVHISYTITLMDLYGLVSDLHH